MKLIMKLIISVIVLAILLYSFQALSRFEQEVENNERESKKQELLHQNSDVYAWLSVEGTRIDYPVAQHPTDDTYYLSHDLDGNQTYYGAIFTELVNSKTLEDPVTIIYGHAITDGAMFGTLDKFAERDFFEKHQTITIDSIDKHYEYQVIAAHPYSDEHLYDSYDLGNRDGVTNYIQTLKDRALSNGGGHRQSSIDIEHDKFLILSTCDAVESDQRYVVTARLVTVEERKTDDESNKTF